MVAHAILPILVWGVSWGKSLGKFGGRVRFFFFFFFFFARLVEAAEVFHDALTRPFERCSNPCPELDQVRHPPGLTPTMPALFR